MGEWGDRLDWLHDQLFGGSYDPDFWDEVNAQYRAHLQFIEAQREQMEKIAKWPTFKATMDGNTFICHQAKRKSGKHVVLYILQEDYTPYIMEQMAANPRAPYVWIEAPQSAVTLEPINTKERGE